MSRIRFLIVVGLAASLDLCLESRRQVVAGQRPARDSRDLHGREEQGRVCLPPRHGVWRVDRSRTGRRDPQSQVILPFTRPAISCMRRTRSWTFAGKDGGSVSAFAIDRATGRLAALNQESSVGGGPVYLVVDKTGRNVVVSSYGGVSVAVLPIGRGRQAGAGAPLSSSTRDRASTRNSQKDPARTRSISTLAIASPTRPTSAR